MSSHLNIEQVKPIQYYRHLFKTLIKYKQLPSYFIFYPTSRCNGNAAIVFITTV